MHQGSEKAIGFAVATTTTGAIGWMGAPSLLNALMVILTFVATVTAWLVLRSEKREEADRRKREAARHEHLAATVEAIGMTQIEVAAMVARLVHPHLTEDQLIKKGE